MKVPVVQQDLPSAETYQAICQALASLSGASDHVFGRLQQRISERAGKMHDFSAFRTAQCIKADLRSASGGRSSFIHVPHLSQITPHHSRRACTMLRPRSRPWRRLTAHRSRHR